MNVFPCEYYLHKTFKHAYADSSLSTPFLENKLLIKHPFNGRVLIYDKATLHAQVSSDSHSFAIFLNCKLCADFQETVLSETL